LMIFSTMFLPTGFLLLSKGSENGRCVSTVCGSGRPAYHTERGG
jgi:hypothetical protein